MESGVDQPVPERVSPSGKGGGGCARAALYGFAVLWILLTTVGAQFFSWMVDEVQFEGLPAGLHVIRAVISIVYGLFVFIPMIFLARAWKTSSDRAIFQSWALAGFFAVALSIRGAAGLTASQTANLLQIVGAVIYIVIVSYWLRRQNRRFSASDAGKWVWPVVLLVAGLISLPWFAWGALGSVVDLLLGLLAAAAFGAAAVLTLGVGWELGASADQRQTFGAFAGTSLTAALTLIVMATGFGTVGLQVVLALILAPLGWTLGALVFVHRTRQEAPAWRAIFFLIAAVAALPLLFLDPDELALIIGLGNGEIIQWAERIAEANLAIHLAAGLILFFLRFSLPRLSAGVRWASAAVVWLAALGLYFAIGQPGFYGEQLFVILKDQADVSQAKGMANLDERRAFVYHTLVDHAQTTQAGIREALDRFGLDYTPYYIVNGIRVNGGPLIRFWLERRPEVDRILDNPELRPLPEKPGQSRGEAAAPTSSPWNVSMIGADRVWAEFGATGSGIVVGQSDSGVQGDHPELADSYRGRSDGNDYNWYDPWNNSQFPTDIGGHGTHTLGTIVGDVVGIAPDATWFGCVNLARNLGNPAFYLDCMQFMLAPFPQKGDPFKDGDPARAADVLNNSWGCPWIEGCDAKSLQPAVDALRSAGIFVVASAGNEGQVGCGSVSDPPAIYDSAYSVGAIDNARTLAMFSSLGPVIVDGSMRVKPDIVAPGVDILSSFPGNTYSVLQGTSMAGPHVVGVVALMWSANPALVGNIEKTEEILDRSADPYQGNVPGCAASTSSNVPNVVSGYGIVDAYKAVQMALQP